MRTRREILLHKLLPLEKMLAGRELHKLNPDLSLLFSAWLWRVNKEVTLVKGPHSRGRNPWWRAKEEQMVEELKRAQLNQKIKSIKVQETSKDLNLNIEDQLTSTRANTMPAGMLKAARRSRPTRGYRRCSRRCRRWSSRCSSRCRTWLGSRIQLVPKVNN